METFRFIIANTTVFPEGTDLSKVTGEDLINLISDEERGVYEGKKWGGITFYNFEVPRGLLTENQITMIGRGIAFSKGWRIDNTASCIQSLDREYDWLRDLAEEQ
jgi:hypothetical protein